MSNNAVALPGIRVPTRFQNKPIKRLGEGISGGYPIIRIRGSKWWLSTGKDEEVRIPRDEITVVLLRDPEYNSRAYYKAYKGEGSKGDRPLCSSIRGITPDAGVPMPQSETCALCPRNKTYTNENGITKRDCSNGRRLAVFPWVDWTKALLGAPILRPALLRVPGSSLKALKDYGTKLARSNVNYFALVTKISFEPNKPYPKLIFNYSEEEEHQIDDASAAIIEEMLESEEAMNVTGESGGSTEMREIDHEDGETLGEETSKPKPAAVSLAEIVAKARAKEEAAKIIEGEVIERPTTTLVKPRPKVKVKAEIVREPEPQAEAEVVEESADAGLKNEVLDILAKLGK